MQLLCQKESDMAEYYRALVQQDENQRVLIHDIRRHLASIDTLAAAKETDKIHAYIQQLQTSFGLKSVQRVIDRYDGAIKMYFDLPTLTFHTILTLRPEKC